MAERPCRRGREGEKKNWNARRNQELCDKVRLLVEREDTGVQALVEIEDDKIVLNLLELSRSKLNFGKGVLLRAHKVGNDKCIHGGTSIHEIAHLGTVIIKFEKAWKQEKDKSQGTENLVDDKSATKATKLTESTARDLDNYAKSNNRLVRSGEQPKDQRTCSSMIMQKESIYSDVENQRSRFGVTKITSKEKEIIILNKKLEVESPEGFVFKILPDNYAHHKESSYYESSFASQEELKASKDKIRTTRGWSLWQTEKGPHCWGVRVTDSNGRDFSATQHSGNKTPRTDRTRTAIVTTTYIHQVRKFSVQVKLNHKAVRDAKEVLRAKLDKQRQAVNKFNNKYCSFVYSGQYSAGGWFQTKNTARSKKVVEVAVIAEKAIKKVKRSPRYRTYQPRLEKEIENLQNCIVMPSMGATKSDFTPVYEIMEKQAERTGDKELQKAAAIMTMYMKGTSMPMTNACSPEAHYVVLLGDSGMGKSTIVEKLTGEKGRGSNTSKSFTRTSEPFWVPDGTLVVSDTPGSNSRKDKLENNLSIAGALNFRPVSRIFIVVKAETRIDSVIDKVCKYADNFEELPFDVVGVLVTHMDMVEWREDDFVSAVDHDLGINAVVFSSISTNGKELLSNILNTCLEKYDLTINDENFLKLFKIQNSHRKILQFTSDEVKRFSAIKKAFDEERKLIDGNNQVDLVFEFQAYMTDEIFEAKTRMSEQNKFTFEGENAVIEAGHVINMVNQLHTVLRDIRTECFQHHCDYGWSEFRKCPYCGLVWTKTEECSGNKICGNERPAASVTRGSTVVALGTFSFNWIGDKLEIKTGRRFIGEFGCGKTINWKDMATACVPSEISQSVKVCEDKIGKLSPSRFNFPGKVQALIRAFENIIK